MSHTLEKEASDILVSTYQNVVVRRCLWMFDVFYSAVDTLKTIQITVPSLGRQDHTSNVILHAT